MITVRISGGTATFVYDDRLRGLMDRAGGRSETVRASSVEPEGDGWTVRMHREFGGEKLPGVYRLREEALRAERDYLRARRGL